MSQDSREIARSKGLPPEAYDEDARDVLDVDGEACVRRLETGEGPDPLADVPDRPPMR